MGVLPLGPRLAVTYSTREAGAQQSAKKDQKRLKSPEGSHRGRIQDEATTGRINATDEEIICLMGSPL